MFCTRKRENKNMSSYYTCYTSMNIPWKDRRKLIINLLSFVVGGGDGEMGGRGRGGRESSSPPLTLFLERGECLTCFKKKNNKPTT